jgi:predicted DNA-binding ribbon-helix-helix protein
VAEKLHTVGVKLNDEEFGRLKEMADEDDRTVVRYTTRLVKEHGQYSDLTE